MSLSLRNSVARSSSADVGKKDGTDALVRADIKRAPHQRVPSKHSLLNQTSALTRCIQSVLSLAFMSIAHMGPLRER